MHYRRRLILIITAVVVVVCLAYVWWKPVSQSASTAAPAKAKAEKPVPVHILSVQRGSISLQLMATGDSHVALGAYVTTNGTPIVTIVAMDTVKVRVPISERDIGKIRPGINARLRVDAYPDEVFTGTVLRISPIIDPTSRNGEIEIHVANPAYRLKPGMFTRVALSVAQQHDVVVIPRDALHVDAQGAAVFVVQEGTVSAIRRWASSQALQEGQNMISVL